MAKQMELVALFLGACFLCGAVTGLIESLHATAGAQAASSSGAPSRVGNGRVPEAARAHDRPRDPGHRDREHHQALMLEHDAQREAQHQADEAESLRLSRK